MAYDIKKIITKDTLASLTIPAGWKIITNNLLDIDFSKAELNLVKEIVDIYFDYEVFGAEYSHANREPKYKFYIYVHCSKSTNLKYKFNYELSYFLVNANTKEPDFHEKKNHSNLKDLVADLNDLFILVYYDFELIVKNKKLHTKLL